MSVGALKRLAAAAWALSPVLLAAVVAVSYGGPGGLRPPYLSPYESPLPDGLSMLASILDEYGDVVVARGPGGLLGVLAEARGYDRVVLVVVSPGAPYTRGEVEALRKLGGSLALLVMDETGVSNSLLEALAGARIDGRLVEERGARPLGEWSGVHALQCTRLGVWGVADLPSLVAEAPEGAEVVCTLQPLLGEELVYHGGQRIVGPPVAAVHVEAPVEAVVVADGSVCINYYLDPPTYMPQSNEQLCRALAGLLAGGDTLFILDETHYPEAPSLLSPREAAGLVVASLPALASAAFARSPIAASAAVAAAGLIIGAAALKPPEPRVWRPPARAAARLKRLRSLGLQGGGAANLQNLKRLGGLGFWIRRLATGRG